MAINTTRFPLRSTHPRSATARGGAQPVRPSDDEILGLLTSVTRPTTNPPPSAAEPAAFRGQTRDSAPQWRGGPSATQKTGGAETSQALPQVSAEADNADANSSVAAQQGSVNAASQLTPEVAEILDAHPQLRAAWDTAQKFQSVFATPAAAQDAKSQLDDLDAMFFSGDPSAQAALAARIHELSPGAFHALAQAMQAHAAQVAAQSTATLNAPAQDHAGTRLTNRQSQPETSSEPSIHMATDSGPASPAQGGSYEPRTVSDSSQATATQDLAAAPTSHSFAGKQSPNAGDNSSQSGTELGNAAARATQLAFFHSTNSAAVHQVLAAIESQVTHLLPASVSAPTKTRIVGEIYRELGAALGANRQLGHQLRQAFRSGAKDVAHQRAIVGLVAGRARQALPSIARRVINEWTHGVVAANQEKLSRQSASAKRVDISGAASSDGVNRRPVSPREVDYKRLSDADILNL